MISKPSNSDLPKFSWWDLIKALYFLLDEKRKKYFIYTGILIGVLFYELVPTLIVASVIDFFTYYKIGDPLGEFYFYIGLFTISWGIVSLIRLSIKKKLTNIQSNVSYFTRVKGFERLLDFSISWHDKENTGNKVQKIQSGTESLKQLQTLLSNDFFVHVTGILGVLVSFIFLNYIFFIYSLVYILIFMLIQMSYYRRMVQMNNESAVLMEKAGGTYFEGLNNILTIKTLGVKDDFKNNINNREALKRDQSIKKVSMMNDKWKFFQVVNAVSIGAILLLSGQNFIAGTISIGSIFIIYNYFQKLNHSVSKSTDLIEKLIDAKVNISRMMPIFWDDSSVGFGNLDFPKTWNKITIKNGFFKYKNNQLESTETTKKVGLDNVSFEVNRNEKIGIVGKSGSGKSTLSKILLGLYKFDSGNFLVNDVNFYDIKHDEITKEITLVLQDSEMFNLSLKENITLMRNFDKELFEKAISISQLSELVEKLPEGIETLIGEKGYRLSGGERQRIGIARAIYKDSQIIILDESTSSLDSKTEELIQKAFEENLKNKTVISIAHRVSTLKNVDKIIVFDEGKVVEQGTFNELSQNRSSKFFEVYSHQGV